MIEEQEGTENVEINQQQPGNDNNAEPEIEDKISALSAFLDKEDIDGLNKEINPQGDTQNKGDDKEEENGDDENQNQPGDEKSGEEKKEDKKPEEKEKPQGKNIFGLNKKQGKKGEEVVIETPDHILDVIKTKFGQEYKELKDTPKFFETVQGWRSKAEKADSFEKENKQIKDFLTSLPDDVFTALQKIEKGEDYYEAFSGRPKFDYKTPVEKQDIKQLVNHYYPGKFTEEDLKDENPSDALQIAMDASKDKFIAEQRVHEDKRARITKDAENAQKAHEASVQSSVSLLKQTFPDMDPDALKDVQSVLEGGPNSVLSFFYNNDGTTKPEAAEMFMMAKHGKSQIEEMMNIASNLTETKINEGIVSRGADTKKPVKTSAQRDQISDEEKQQLEGLERLTKKSKSTF